MFTSAYVQHVYLVAETGHKYSVLYHATTELAISGHEVNDLNSVYTEPLVCMCVGLYSGSAFSLHT